MATSAVANSDLVGQYEKAQAATTSGASKSMTDKDTFLKLLVAQMTNQDPLNPVEDKEFVSQLSQFTTVEELQNLNKTASGVGEIVTRSQVSNAVGLIGAAVIAEGDQVTFIPGGGVDGKDYVSELQATLPTSASEVYVNIYSVKDDGTTGGRVFSGTLGKKNAGEFDVPWDGRDSNGNLVAEGNYIVNVSAVDSNGKNMLVTSKSAGLVVGVDTKADGNHTLVLDGGRKASYSNVKQIRYINNSTPPAKEEKTEE